MKVAFESVSVAIGRTPIVHDVTLTVPTGTFLALLGPNGSGKSTLLRTVYRALTPTRGRVTVGGADVQRAAPREAALRVAVMAQESSHEFPMTVREVALLGRVPHQRGFGAASDRDHALVQAALGDVGAATLADRDFGGLSGGEKQRVLLARALVQEAPVLVLDEPTNHLDIGFQLDLMRLVAERGLTTIAALHDMNLAAEFCDVVAVMRDGRLLAHGAPQDVLTGELIGAAFGVRSAQVPHPLTGGTLIAFAGRADHLVAQAGSAAYDTSAVCR